MARCGAALYSAHTSEYWALNDGDFDEFNGLNFGRLDGHFCSKNASKYACIHVVDFGCIFGDFHAKYGVWVCVNLWAKNILKLAQWAKKVA